MTSIPGHAEYYRDKILAAQEDVKAHLDDRLISIRLVKYMDEQMYAFQTLEHVPSTENVRVLGELLFNDWNGDLTVQEGMQLPRLCLGAVCAMGNLPLVRKPFRETQGHQAQEQLEGWRQWYQEIKDGKRTFRFEGDPTEYDLNGPAPKEKLERLALASRMDKDRAARHGGADAATNPELPASSITPLIALILAAGTVIVSMAWYFRRAAAR